MPEPALQLANDDSPDAALELRGLCKSFGPNEVLHDVSVRFAAGRVTVVLGPSGSGKSVMLKHIIGLLRPTAGEVWFHGRRIDQMNERELARLRTRFGFLFQQGALFDSMTVRENLEFPLREHHAGGAQERIDQVRHVLRLVGLEDKLDAMPEDLSGGQRKRIALARAIVLEPEIILYDEPTTGLDPINSDVIHELILKLQRDLTVTSIVVTHDLDIAFKVADRLVIMQGGRVVTEGTPEQIQNTDDEFVRRFLAGRASKEDLAALQVNGASTPGRVDSGQARRAVSGEAG